MFKSFAIYIMPQGTASWCSRFQYIYFWLNCIGIHQRCDEYSTLVNAVALDCYQYIEHFWMSFPKCWLNCFMIHQKKSDHTLQTHCVWRILPRQKGLTAERGVSGQIRNEGQRSLLYNVGRWKSNINIMICHWQYFWAQRKTSTQILHRPPLPAIFLCFWL